MKRKHLSALIFAASVTNLPVFATDYIVDSEIDTLKSFNIEEAIVVASPKESTVLKQQPLSSTLFGRRDLAQLGVTSVKELSAYAPNFHMPEYGSRLTSAVYIRGVGARMNTPSIGLYVDNVAYTDKSAYDFSFMDVERVDVLRGPQGTLYGRNTMGGLIRLYTADPLKKEGTEIDLGGATHGGRYHAKTTTYLHASDQLAFSVGGFYEGQAGFFDNVTTGKEADKMSAGGGKIRAVWQPRSSLRLDLSASYEYSDEDACPYYLKGYDTEDFPSLADKVGQISQNRQSNYRRGLFSSGLSVEWKTPEFVFSSVTGYQNLDDRLKMDQDFTSLDVFSLTQSQRMNAVTEEITLRSHSDKRWQWTTGAFFMYQNMDTDCPVNFYEDGVDFLNAQFKGAPMKIKITNKSLPFSASLETPSLNTAMFHQSRINNLFIDGLSLTLGLRLDYDHRQLNLLSALERPLFFDFKLPMPGFPEMNLGPVSANLTGNLKDDTWQFLPKVALQYDFRQGNIFAAVSKGYRSGGYNIQAYSDLAQQLLRKNMFDAALGTMKPHASRAGMPSFEAPDIKTLAYKPEESWNYELGGRLHFLDGAIALDYTLFFMQTKNQQLARFADSGMGRVMVNAGKSQNYGAEFAMRSYWLDNRLKLVASYGFTHAELKEHDLGDVDYSGNRVPFAPEHTLGAYAQFRQPLNGRLFKAFHVGANVQGAGKIYWDEANKFNQPFYATMGANIGVELIGNVQFELWGKNLTGSKYDAFSFVSMGNRFSQWGNPRHFGANLNIRF